MQQGETIEAMLSVKHGGMLSRNTSSTLGAFAVPMATSLAEFLTQAAAVWQKAHKPGKPQWQWRCLSSPKHQSLTAVSPDGELGADDTTTIAREVAHCSAKVSAKKTHVILDFRPTLSGRLFQHNVVTSLLDTLGCERLGATWILCLKGS